ncbi:hypothetical protein ACFSVM_04175 [Paenibacillus shunpengii]|uniref:Uncharacterized protein n=1 Tax=Paenibacillus shunpengii TaxID=2054424 RepID=A0ABW5SJ52_9BACL|nr:hypothetical protein [Paenibacillus sp. PDC88]SDW34775.1 hypothetical protein SAMN05518848_1011097 [Paenibacillus sp. PDC88]
MNIENVDIEISELHERFKASNLPLRYTLQEADHLLKSKYGVVVVNPLEVSDLKKDPLIHYNHIVKIYHVNDSQILSSIFTSQEQEMIKEMQAIHATVPSDEDSLTGAERLWRKIRQGRLLRIIIESADKQYITGFTLQGMSQQLLQELYILRGLREEECHLGNENYATYLKLLHQRGYI